MALRNKLIAGGLAAFAMLATATVAMAAPAYVTSNVNVRSGPGTGYGVVDTLRRGEQVDVQQCRGSWCYVEKRGPDGWVSANYLSAGGNGGGWGGGGWDNGWNRPPPPPPVWNPRPPRPPHWGGGWDRPRPPHWGGGWDGRPPRPYPGNPGGSVCFNGPNGYVCMGN
ncbi:hypothetical protein GCM10007913_05500 [Devosia yakushimensis]|uniref:SH3b domain-containing protein n=1 Tax=Devosia yakushimensis TaxID=470028 RepID=A0ABQ5U9J1_9HYPH|nr:SH3 domain-containing protein [Devosia yakushimensis]GLQ08618.1 hypothetical protein GCM10007913_05500 [Devosia yakushimensis]